MDLVYGVAVVGLGDSEAVPCEGAVAVLVICYGRVAVVVGVDGEVPVRAVKSDSVGE